MNTLTPPSAVDLPVLKFLARICEDLDLPDARFEEAKERYEAIGRLLAEEGNPLAKYRPLIYVQGSTRLHTVNRPLRGDEFDIDLICELRDLRGRPVEEVFREVRAALLADKTYAKMLSEKKRCLRLTYANLFHLDITPAQPDRVQGPECILVTDRPTQQWKPSNPKDYAEWFATVAAIPPRIRLATQKTAQFETYLEARGEVEPIQNPKKMRPVLNRIVQIFKRHRDVMFAEDGKNAPISAIITTTAAWAYEEACRTERESLLDLILAVARLLERKLGPAVATVAGMPIFSVPNPRNPHENYADKWERHPERQEAFFRWSRVLVQYLEGLRSLEGRGTDAAYKYLATGFGQELVKRSLIDSAQNLKAAVAAKAVGITTAGAIVSASAARVAAAPQTFHQ